MWAFEILLTAVLPLIGALLWLRRRLALKQQWHFPPGPAGLPLVGNLLSLLRASHPHLQFSEWATTYGGVYTGTILTKKVVVVSCPKMMRQVFEHPASAGKFGLEPITLLSGGAFGITSTEGRIWKEQRSFCVRALRHFGMGKRHEIQAKILAEANHAVQGIAAQAENSNGVISNPIDLLKTGTSNTLWKIIRGDRFPLEDARVKKITTEYWQAANYSLKTGLALFPWLKRVAPGWSGYRDLEECSRSLRSFIREQFEEHQRYRGEGEEKGEPLDMLDMYLDQLEQSRKSGDPTSSFYGEVGWTHSVAVIAELFAGGGESTPHTLNWLILLLSHHPEVQRRLQEEIDQVLGSQEPCLGDKSRMPYTEAVILETLRKCPAFPLSTPHKLLEDVTFPSGLTLPSGTLLLSNMHQAHMNPRFWGDPEVFRPERFLPQNDVDSDDTLPERKASVVVFNVGKRVCLGEPLAMDVLFLFVVKLFQTFHLSPFPLGVEGDFESAEAFLMLAKPFDILVKQRNTFRP